MDDLVYVYGSLIPIKAYQATIGTIFAFAILSYTAGTAVKVNTCRFLFADDLLLLLAMVFLIPCTALAFVGADTFYRGYAILRYPELISSTPAEDYSSLARNGFVWFSSFTVLAWTTIFCSKAYILRISWNLLRKTFWIQGQFWGVCICTGASWAVLFATAFILQPYDYFEPDSYFGHGSDVLFLAMNGLTTVLDIITGLMTALMLYVRLSRSSTPKAYRKTMFISWSTIFVMAIFTILRICKLYDAVHIDIVWMVLWLYLEAGVSIIILSIPVFRSTASTDKLPEAQKDSDIHMEALTDDENTTIDGSINEPHRTGNHEHQSAGDDSHIDPCSLRGATPIHAFAPKTTKQTVYAIV